MMATEGKGTAMKTDITEEIMGHGASEIIALRMIISIEAPNKLSLKPWSTSKEDDSSTSTSWSI